MVNRLEESKLEMYLTVLGAPLSSVSFSPFDDWSKSESRLRKLHNLSECGQRMDVGPGPISPSLQVQQKRKFSQDACQCQTILKRSP